MYVSNIDKEELRKTIRDLFSLKQEGEYWDFKREWYSKKTAFLHDIICMANNLANHDAYIIIGIDEKDNYNIFDITNDENRRKTQNIVDFLRVKSFAGGIRPIVYVETLDNFNGEGKNIDVIVIKNSTNTPFYLTTRFEGVLPYHIYTRSMDTNTPIDSSAHINDVEYLWRKRFHIDGSPLERVNHFVSNKSDWTFSPGKIEGKYFYKLAPEYTIESQVDESRTGYEYYLLSQIDKTPHWHTVEIKYHQTTIEMLLGISLDGGRAFVIAPQQACFSWDNRAQTDILYSYYIVDSLRFKLLDFYSDKESNEYLFDRQKFLSVILVFMSENERKAFTVYLRNNKEEFEKSLEKKNDPFPHLEVEENGYWTPLKKQYNEALVLNTMLYDFRKNILMIIMKRMSYNINLCDLVTVILNL